jgi:hypothetical protein
VLHVCTPLFEHRFVPGAQTPVHAPATHAWFAHAAPSIQVPVASHVCTTRPLHPLAFGLQLPEQAPPRHTFLHRVPGCQLPVASQVRGVRSLQSLVVGVHSPVQPSSPQTKLHVSSRVVVSKSTPHSSRSVPWQKIAPGVFCSQPAAMGWHDPALLPSVVSQLLLPEQFPLGCQVPPLQMS